MAPNEFNPSPWMVEAFGDLSTDVAAALARSAATAQTDGQEAKAGSRLGTNEPYGATVWIAFAHETAAELKALGAELIRPAGCRYQLAVVRGVLVLAVKLPTNSNGVDEMTLDSAVRRRVLKLESTHPDSTLDFGDDYELHDSDGHPVLDSDFGTATRSVLVVMEGDARGGVRRLHIGDVRLDGTLVTWLHREDLPVVMTSHPGLVALDLKQAEESFTAGMVPPMVLGLTTSDGDEMSSSDEEANAAGTADGS